MAVLPFENLSGDEDQLHLADGTTEALSAALAQVRSINVISRTSVMRFQGVRRPVPEIARELGVASILEGSVTRSGDRIRVTAQLIDAATDRHLWAETYTGPIGDLLTFQSRVARAVAREVHVTLSPPEEARLAQIRSVDLAVQEAFSRHGSSGTGARPRDCHRPSSTSARRSRSIHRTRRPGPDWPTPTTSFRAMERSRPGAHWAKPRHTRSPHYRSIPRSRRPMPPWRRSSTHSTGTGRAPGGAS